MRQDYLKVKQEFEKLKDGTIVMPRTRVFNVNYVPILSASGQPLGLRITYDAEFSQPGYYNPELQVSFDYKILEWRGVVAWYSLSSSIAPVPTEESPQERPHPLALGAGYTYLANTTYHFKLDLVPAYVIQNEQKKYCLDNQRFNHDPLVRARWEAIRASKEWVSLRVSIQNAGFEGLIENFYPQQMIYNTYLADGAGECVPKTTAFLATRSTKVLLLQHCSHICRVLVFSNPFNVPDFLMISREVVVHDAGTHFAPQHHS